MLTMVLTWLLVWVAAIRATPTPGAEHAPGATPEHVPHLCAGLARQADGGVEQRLRDGRG